MEKKGLGSGVGGAPAAESTELLDHTLVDPAGPPAHSTQVDLHAATSILSSALQSAPPPPPLPRASALDLNARTSILPQRTPTPASPRTHSSTGNSVPEIAPGALPKDGDRIRHYELIRKLGEGGMGSVFLARDNKLGRRVAIKFLHTQNAELAQRFILEARTTARCSHENIVVIYEAEELNGQPYMVLEYLQGQPLSKLVTHGKPMPPGRVVELLVPVVRALDCAHGQGIVHRDLKYDNVYVTDSGTIKVLDFGIAKVLGNEERAVESAASGKPAASGDPFGADAETLDFGKDITDLTRHGAIMGTVAYMSPEQWGNGVAIDHRTDIWAVGIMLFRMLSGQHPLQGLQGAALKVTARLDQPMPSLRGVAPGVPAELCDVVDRCLRKKKEERFPDAVSLLRALEPFLPGRFKGALKIDESPYAGLASFQETDADRFFGRNQEIAAVVNRVRDQPLIAVVGPSGAGKSSFVRAGVVPALKRSGEAWEALVLRPGREPLVALANVVAPLVSTSGSVADDLQEQQQLVERLRTEPGYVGSVLRSRARREKKNILLFVDQFEELYTLVPDLEQRRAFTACLGGIADDATSPTRVVVSIRSDFLDRVPEDQRFMNELGHGLFFVTSPNRDGLRDALVQPAEMAGYHFESGAIVDDMLEHLAATQGALPLLQFAASKLWESRDPARRLLTSASYEAIGGIAGALASHADSVLNELSPQARGLAKTLFLRLITPERTRALVSVEELRELSKDADEVQRLVDQLVRARLLVVQTGGSGATLEIVHESLLHSWPTLRRWLDESGEDSAFLEQLRTAAKQWAGMGHDAGLLWRGDMVEEARRFQRRYRGELPSVQGQFLDEVFAQEARLARRKKVLAVGGVVFLCGLVAAAFIALIVIRAAQKEAVRQAEAAMLAEAAAKSAEAEAKQNLVEVQKKERERAEAARRAEEASAQLQSKNGELLDALSRAEEARLRASQAQRNAEKNAKAARRAREEAVKAAQEAEMLARREAERARRLQSQLGSAVVESLK